MRWLFSWNGKQVADLQFHQVNAELFCDVVNNVESKGILLFSNNQE